MRRAPSELSVVSLQQERGRDRKTNRCRLLCKALAHLCAQQASEEILLPTRSQELSERHTLVLDLDDTLVHVRSHRESYKDVEVDISEAEVPTFVYVQLRPGLLEFLSTAYTLFEVVLFTAAQQSYAEPICVATGITAKTHWRLYRHHCSVRRMRRVKDLSRLGRDLARVAILDDSPQPDYRANAIPISAWSGQQFDSALERLQPVLRDLAAAPHVPDFLSSCPAVL